MKKRIVSLAMVCAVSLGLVGIAPNPARADRCRQVYGYYTVWVQVWGLTGYSWQVTPQYGWHQECVGA
jgi:hypothetical protein